jgi:glyoxylase-like metal-dependent hydrolase (beta-lactamase superfamily II)
MRNLRWLVFSFLVSLFLCPGPLLAADKVFDIKPVADGVYAAIAKPTFRTNCNSAIVLLDDGVLVVDTQSKPSAARELIGEIKRLTDKPVKYVVITHMHGDHTQGAEAYVSAWPGVEIISSEATRESIENQGVARMKRDLATVPQQIEKLKGDLQKASDAQQKEQIRQSLGQAEAYLAEIKPSQMVLPTLTIKRSLILQRKSRTVEIFWLGKAHTDGDLFVYLPKEKVMIAGDVLHSFIPITKDSYPYDWIHTLDAAEKFDFDYVIGGHGDVLRGKATFELWKQYFTDLMAEAAQVYAAGGTLDDARKRAVPILSAKYGGKFPGRFSSSVVSDVEKAYRVVSGATD